MQLLFGRMPISYYLFGGALQTAFTLASRFGYRFLLIERGRLRKTQRQQRGSRIMLIGAGAAGQMILRDILRAREVNGRVCCIIDDDERKWHRYVEGVPVVGGRDDILASVEKYQIEKIFVAIPSASAQEKRDILNICKRNRLRAEKSARHVSAGQRRRNAERHERGVGRRSAGPRAN